MCFPGFGNLWSLLFSNPSTPSQGNASVEEVPAVAEVSGKPPPLFALIVGINEYICQDADIENLDGAVPDAKAMKTYLETSLGVPTSQIKTLLNEEATREAIITNLCELQTDPRIRDGDPILIFYAGHGGTAKAPDGWETGGSDIQVLLSHDFQYASHDNRVHAIPDRTIGSLLEQIAAAKGDNITVIFDCCHSGSLTRRPNSDGRVRGVNMLIKLHSDLDKDIWRGNRGSSIAPGFLKSGLRSHVLLSACGAEETAREEGGRGYFTKRLLGALEDIGADKVTYAGLIQQIPCLPRQNPQCEGYNRGRICFNSKVPGRSSRMYVVRKVGQEYVMEAGTAHGITHGAIFALYTDRNSALTQASVATLEALKANAVTTILVPLPDSARPDINEQAFALLIKAGEDESFRVHVEPDEALETILDEVAEEREKYHPTHPKIIRVEKEEAEMELAIDGGKLVFNILDPLVRTQGLHRLYGTTLLTLEDVRPVIYKAAHYFWHLRRTGNTKHLQRAIDIELRRLEEVDEEYDDMFNPVRRPYGPNLIKDGVIDIAVEKDAIYGIKIVNRSKIALHASLFYFDNSDLSITSYFQPGLSAGKVDPPLRPESSITIGYGNTGTVPLVYTLREGQYVDVGYLKLFLSVNHVDLSDIPQDSPFEGHLKATGLFKQAAGDLWSTVLITFVQRRNPSA